MIPITPSWTLFLDRDGVINHEIKGDYIRNWQQFAFMEKALDAMKILSSAFKRIIIVTNQRGVGLNLMTLEDLETIHRNMTHEIEKHGGRIDKIYYCTDHDRQNSICRKPKPEMAFRAKKDFPEIDLSKSIIVGNSESDMEFGRNAGMKTVFILDKKSPKPCKADLIDCTCASLFEFATNTIVSLE
ncbi:MAG: D-glycero-alpha-D-manno-heptose-1,7-bisphosphate 7-phosphatase [Bacteroidia bacterium]